MSLNREASNPRTRIQRDARFNLRAVRRSVGEDIRNARLDAGISLGRLAAAADVSKGYVHEIEAGEATPSVEILARVSAALGGRISVQYRPGTGPAIRDHVQASMIEGLLGLIHSRWRRFLEVNVYRPVRGVIDLVLDEPEEGVLVASEAHSQLRRLEQQLRWAGAKADALATGGSNELTSFAGQRRSSRLLLLRSTASTRELARTHRELLAAAYPASHESALEALTSTYPWPGPSLIWMEAGRTAARVLDRQPRGVLLDRTNVRVRS